MSTPLLSSVAATPPAARRHPSLVEQVTDGIGGQIRSGSFAPGAMLPSVQALSDMWGVSRTVTREALARLSAEGLVTSRQGLGVFVCDALPAETFSIAPGPELDDLKRILELRLGVEIEAAGFAALRRSDTDIAVLREALEAMVRLDRAGDIDAGIEADINFHRAICAATGNGHFADLFVFLSQFFRKNISVSRRNSAGRAGGSADAAREHRAIFDAILVGDAPGARKAARIHVLNTGTRLGIDIEAGATDAVAAARIS
jgi:GntR family transcriptional repressor for pyruvate dehydrogenase complex